MLTTLYRQRKLATLKTAGERQKRVTSEGAHVWVSASAGTGKTYSLTSRIVRLLVTDPSLSPRQILALTFTKAAAAEMAERVRGMFMRWAVASFEEVRSALEHVLGRSPSEAEVHRAQGLFWQVLDDQVDINTIHGFCQHLLAQFPLEAGVPPAFLLVEGGDKADLLQAALKDVWAACVNDDADAELGDFFRFFMATLGEREATAALHDFVTQAQRFQRMAALYGSGADGWAGVLSALAGALELETEVSPQGLEALQQRLVPSSVSADLQELAQVLATSGGKLAQGRGEKLLSVFGRIGAGGTVSFDEVRAVYESVLLTSDGDYRPFEKLVDKATLKALQQTGAEERCAAAFALEQERFLRIVEGVKNARAFVLTKAMVMLGERILEQYQAKKEDRGALDFDDLIFYTHRLLTASSAAEWVRYKTDRHIRHVLVDEAQDTDYDQWDIVRSLVEEFFETEDVVDGREEFVAPSGISFAPYSSERTLFAVGDFKQAIYRFRGAQPDVFAAMEQYLRNHAVLRPFLDVRLEDLTVSFRSSASVLSFVDGVFAAPARAAAIDPRVASAAGEHAENGATCLPTHDPFHDDMGGRVEIWPLCAGFVAEDAEASEGEGLAVETDGEEGEEAAPKWMLPAERLALLQRRQASSAWGALAEKVARAIQGILHETKPLASTGALPRLKDVLILFRSRTHMGEVAAALDALGLAHSGVDTFTLTDEPVAQDLLALLRFLSYSADDLALAQAVRSPLFGFSDADLLACHRARERGQSLWLGVLRAGGATEASGGGVIVRAKDILGRLLSMAEFEAPFVLLTQSLALTNGRGRFLALATKGDVAPYGAVNDVVDAVLEAASNWESRTGSTSLVRFVRFMAEGNVAVKRDVGSGENVIRLMTAHNAKGLEAPIVFMPDTTGGFYQQTSKETFLWQRERLGAGEAAREGDAFFLLQKGLSGMRPSLCEGLAEQEKRLVFEDELRLLYVALTRPQERLYIGGVRRKSLDEEKILAASAETVNTWYGHVLQAAVAGVREGGFGVGAAEAAGGASEATGGDLLRPSWERLPDGTWVFSRADVRAEAVPLADAGERAPLSVEMLEGAVVTGREAWMQERAAVEAAAPVVRASDVVKAAHVAAVSLRESMAEAAPDERMYQRGRVIHKLLEVLPLVPEGDREPRAGEILAGLGEAERAGAWRAASGVMAQYPAFFGANSRAEVPLCADVEGKRLEGIVDRLIVTSDEVVILDYKTNATVPSEVPESYRKQMAVYRAMAQAVFGSGRAVRCGVVWTALGVPRVDWV